jgi:hypothetical protein
MRLTLLITIVIAIGLLNGCATQGQGGSTGTRQGATGYGSMPVYDERQRDPTLKGQRWTSGPAYNEGQRSQALEGNTR